MLHIGSRTGTSRRAAFVLPASRRFFCAAILTVVFAACALLVPAEAQRGHPATRKNQPGRSAAADGRKLRSEEHTSELQSRLHLVCRLLLEKKKKNIHTLYVIDSAR